MREKLDGMCQQTDCEEPAAFRVYWPGRVPPPHMCALCAFRAQGIARAMGFDVSIELLGRQQTVRRAEP